MNGFSGGGDVDGERFLGGEEDRWQRDWRSKRARLLLEYELFTETD